MTLDLCIHSCYNVSMSQETIFITKGGMKQTYKLEPLKCPMCLKNFLPKHPRTVYCNTPECDKLRFSTQGKRIRDQLVNQLSKQKCKICNKEYKPRAQNNKGICNDFNCRYDYKIQTNKIRKQKKPKSKDNHRYLLKSFNLTVEEYEAMEEYQDHSCKICNKHKSLNAKDKNGIPKRLFIDHDHETMQIRGLLCHFCNMALGGFKDNIESLENAIRYLKGSKSSKKYISEKKIQEKI